MADLSSILCLDEFEPAAQAALPGPLFAYISGACETNGSHSANRSSFGHYAFITRALVDVSKRSSAITLFGDEYASPFGIAPMGLCALFGYRGDAVLAQAAQAANVPMVMSGSSLIRLEEVRQAAPRTWFQAYLPGDEAAIESLVARIAAAGYTRLVITVDTPINANRENNIRAGFSTPLRPSLRLAAEGLKHPRWLIQTFAQTLLRHGVPHFENNFTTRGAPIFSSTVTRDFAGRGHLSWQHLARIRKQWPHVLMVKGLLNPDDARVAREHGADGLIISNHGGRQLDGAIAPLLVLPEFVKACPDIPVMLDGGVRRGTDVLKALDLGAKCVFVGRPLAYALAVAGQAGVAHAIGLLAKEVNTDMGLLGVTRLEQLGHGQFTRALWQT